MGIYLGGADVGVAQHDVDVPDVSAASPEIGARGAPRAVTGPADVLYTPTTMFFQTAL